MPHERSFDGYLLSDDPSRLDVDAIHAYLRRSYWAAKRPRSVVEKSIRHSLCLGAYTHVGAQVGFARVVTDHATFAYLCDVYVLEAHRRRGLAHALIEMLSSHPELQNLRRFMLVTKDAHTLYQKFGFEITAHPDRVMERLADL